MRRKLIVERRRAKRKLLEPDDGKHLDDCKVDVKALEGDEPKRKTLTHRPFASLVPKKKTSVPR